MRAMFLAYTFMLVKMTAARGPRLRVPTTKTTTKQTAATAVALITQLGMISAGASSPRVAFHRILLKYSANTRLFTAFVPVIPRSTERTTWRHGYMTIWKTHRD